MNIRLKLILTFLSIAGIGAVIGYAGFIGASHIFGIYDLIADEVTPELIMLGEIESLSNKLQLEVISYILLVLLFEDEHPTPFNDELEEFENTNIKLDLVIESLEKHQLETSDNDYEDIFIDEIKILKTNLYDESLALIRMMNETSEHNRDLLIQQKILFENAEDDFEDLIQVRLVAERHELVEVNSIASDVVPDTLSNILIITMTAFSLAVLLGFVISRNISKSLSRLEYAAKSVSEGNYDLNMSNKPSNDELGMFEISFKSMAEIIKKQQQEKNEFISMITHELKTPLQPIQGYIHMLKEKELGNLNEQQINAIIEIDSNSRELLHMIENLLTAQKLEMNKIEFQKEDISLKEFVKSIHNSLLPLMHEKNIRFENLVNTNTHVSGDSKRLKEVFINIVQNSIDFVPNENGTIEIGHYNDRNVAVLYVKDNGVGISKEGIDKIFDKFYQVDTSVTRKHGGTGLGLAICKGYIEKMGGKIWIDSEKTKGTTVFFTIPLE